MNRRGVEKAIKEAKRFLETAEAVRKQLEANESYIVGTKYSGACRRASLDLTRALADLRRPG